MTAGHKSNSTATNYRQDEKIHSHLLATCRSHLRPMKFCLHVLLLGALFVTGRLAVSAQVSAAPTAFSSVLSQMGTAFSSGQLVHSIQLSGHASWYSSSAHDSGTV